jgi:hypothetical protein
LTADESSESHDDEIPNWCPLTDIISDQTADEIKKNPHRRRALGSPSERPLRRTEPQQILAKSSVLPSSTLTFGRQWRRIAEIVAEQ